MPKDYSIVMISDTSGFHKKIDLPEGDLLIHAGDFTSLGNSKEVESFLTWLRKVSRKYTYGSVFIAGDKDKSFDPNYAHLYDDSPIDGEKPQWLKKMLAKYADPTYGIRYLENSSVTVKGLKIWGSPITSTNPEDMAAFCRQRGEDIRQVWNTIPPDTDIVVTHGPAKGTLDVREFSHENLGCEDLKKVISAISPKLFVFGHIHEGYGMTKKLSTIHVNASVCSALYRPTNAAKSIVISK